MSCLIITYDLLAKSGISRSDDYEALRNEIKSYKTWAKITESCYAIVTTKKTTEVRDHLKSVLKKGESVICC
jgi:hypothetical protein